MTYLSDTVLAHVSEVANEPDLGGTRYRLVRCIGRGGMGAVWLADDAVLGREVALKVSAGSPGGGLSERLQRESKVIAGLEHPGIVPVHDAGVLPDGRVYYVMKLVRGERLDEWAKARDLRARLRLFQRICEAVAFAHARGVLHRDLKPQNVMVGEFGEALVMDWGLARYLQEAGAEPRADGDAAAGSGARSSPSAETEAGAVVGTPAFMAPEQARGEPLGAAADVYGLGAILYALLTGRPPRDGRDPEELVRRARDEVPAPPRQIEPALPPSIAAVCEKAMAAVPAGRYASAQELGEDVGRFLDLEPVLARREPLVERVGRLVSRNQVVLTLIGVYLLVRVLLFLLG